ncbi:MAG: hypothetical protein Q9M19_01875 [Mariprofundaceae bacterium]|nr:hypothetical protein [Mariprofundaceae bacterium]
MQVSAQKLLPAQHSSYYLFGEDRDSLFEHADALLAEGEAEAIRLRVDISELGRIEVESRSQGLFGAQVCYALVRNAESATVKQTAHLLQLAASVEQGNRLIVCAAEITWKKALNKKMQAEDVVVSCEFRTPTLAHFQTWFQEAIQQQQLDVTQDAMIFITESLCGMRAACQQLMIRMKLYDADEGVRFDVALVSDLMGERAPDALESYCHAVAMKEAKAIAVLRHLLLNQQVAEVQLLTWLSMRLNQLLMYCWYQNKGERSPIQAAKIFGEGRQKVPQEVRMWTAPELMLALQDLVVVEKQLKGASIETKYMVLERLTLRLIT